MFKPIDPAKNILHIIRSYCPRASPKCAGNGARASSIKSASKHKAFCTSIRRYHPRASTIEGAEAGFTFHRRRRRSAWQDDQQEYIVPGDLKATVEAHRDSKIRPSFYRRTHPGNLTSNEAETSSSSEYKEEDAAQSSRKDERYDFDQVKYTESNHSQSNRHALAHTTAAQTPILSTTYTRVGLRPPISYPIDLPWETEETLNLSDHRQRMNDEISNFAKWATPTNQEHHFRELAAFRECYGLRSLQDLHFELIGSHRSGLANATSDIDIAFVVKMFQQNEALRGPSTSLGRPLIRQTVRKKLYQIEKLLTESGRFDNIEVLHQAFIPLVKARHWGSGVDFQIVYSSQPHRDGDFIQKYLELYPQLLPIYLLVKKALDVRTLADPATGGLGSYPLFLLILASFRLKRISSSDDLVHALMSFLSFCTQEFDALKDCISVEPTMVFPKTPFGQLLSSSTKEEARKNPEFAARVSMSCQTKEHPEQLVIQDPNDLRNNAARRCNSFRRIKKALWTMHITCQTWLDQRSSHGRRKLKNPLEAMISGAVLPIRESRSHFLNWLASDEGKAEINAMEELYQYNSEESSSAGKKAVPMYR